VHAAVIAVLLMQRPPYVNGGVKWV
jgi:hypothetical protein